MDFNIFPSPPVPIFRLPQPSRAAPPANRSSTRTRCLCCGSASARRNGSLAARAKARAGTDELGTDEGLLECPSKPVWGLSSMPIKNDGRDCGLGQEFEPQSHQLRCQTSQNLEHSIRPCSIPCPSSKARNLPGAGRQGRWGKEVGVKGVRFVRSGPR